MVEFGHAQGSTLGGRSRAKQEAQWTASHAQDHDIKTDHRVGAWLASCSGSLSNEKFVNIEV